MLDHIDAEIVEYRIGARLQENTAEKENNWERLRTAHQSNVWRPRPQYVLFGSLHTSKDTTVIDCPIHKLASRCTGEATHNSMMNAVYDKKRELCRRLREWHGQLPDILSTGNPISSDGSRLCLIDFLSCQVVRIFEAVVLSRP